VETCRLTGEREAPGAKRSHRLPCWTSTGRERPTAAVHVLATPPCHSRRPSRGPSLRHSGVVGPPHCGDELPQWGGVPAAQNYTVWQNRATVWQNRATVWQNRATVGQNRAPVWRPLAPLWRATRHTGARPPPHWGAPRGPTGADRPAHCAGFLAQWGLLGLLCPLGLVCHTLLTQHLKLRSWVVTNHVCFKRTMINGLIQIQPLFLN
jgi:hypothetical protein